MESSYGNGMSSPETQRYLIHHPPTHPHDKNNYIMDQKIFRCLKIWNAHLVIAPVGMDIKFLGIEHVYTLIWAHNMFFHGLLLDNNTLL